MKPENRRVAVASFFSGDLLNQVKRSVHNEAIPGELALPTLRITPESFDTYWNKVVMYDTEELLVITDDSIIDVV